MSILLCAAVLAGGFAPLGAEGASPEEIARIGELIYQNECGGRPELLVHWNEGEEFPSLGIGHFIWYPVGVEGPFEESFPALLDFVVAEGVLPPKWITDLPDKGAPWSGRAAFLAEGNSEQIEELRRFLLDTAPLQARFMAKRATAALPKLLAAAPDKRRSHIRAQFERMARSPMGFYPLIDYVNFKGEGVAPTERYGGKGWGLLQVLDTMRGHKLGEAARAEFAQAAEAVLTRRVANAPPQRREQRWLAGWKRRISTYLGGTQ